MATPQEVRQEIKAMREIGMKVTNKMEKKALELVEDPDLECLNSTELVDLAIDICL